MITCLGLIVGMVTSPYAQDVLNQCAEWLKKNPHLWDCESLEFVIDKMTYTTVLDTHIENNEFSMLCEMYDGFTKIGVAK